jgi:hypothetical protein
MAAAGTLAPHWDRPIEPRYRLVADRKKWPGKRERETGLWVMDRRLASIPRFDWKFAAADRAVAQTQNWLLLKGQLKNMRLQFGWDEGGGTS